MRSLWTCDQEVASSAGSPTQLHSDSPLVTEQCNLLPANVQLGR